MDKNEKKIMNKQKMMPDFEKFKELVKKAQKAVDLHPKEIKPGQIWGISGKDYRFVVLSSPEKSITGRDIRVMPVTNKTYVATDMDVILPEDAVYYSESVVLPFQATNIMRDKLDLYLGEIKDEFTKFLIKTDLKGELQPLPDYTRQGNNDPNDPIIFEYNENLKEELFGYAKEVFKIADQVADEANITIFDIVVHKILAYAKLFKETVAEPQVSYLNAMVTGVTNFKSFKQNKKLLLKSHDDISIALTVRSQISELVFTSFRIDDEREISNVRITLTGEECNNIYQDFEVAKLSLKQINYMIPENIAENLTSGFLLKYKLGDREFELPVKFD